MTIDWPDTVESGGVVTATAGVTTVCSPPAIIARGSNRAATRCNHDLDAALPIDTRFLSVARYATVS